MTRVNTKTERMKLCKSRTGMFVPCVVRDYGWPIPNTVVGKGFIIYNYENGSLEAFLTDNDGNELPMKMYNVEQDADNAFLVVYSEAVN